VFQSGPIFGNIILGDEINRIIYSIIGIPPHVDVHDARDGQKDEILGRALALAREKR
jgi:hypothetical protein